MSVSKFLIYLAALAVGVATAVVARSQGFEWAIVNWKVRHDFPEVRRIEPKQLTDWLNDPKRRQPLLLDVRTKAEFDVSHIHSAQRVEPGSPAINFPRDKPIVTYCSVGYRSGAFAKKLQMLATKTCRTCPVPSFSGRMKVIRSNETASTPIKCIPTTRAGANF